MAGGIRKTAAGNWRAYWRDPAGRQTSKTFGTKREATVFLAQMTATTSSGAYVSPHAGRVTFGEHARAWMASWNNEATTLARDASIMRTHVLAQWGSWQLAKIDHMAVQTWITGLSARLSPATVAECRRLTSAVMRSAVRNRLIPFNPCEEVKVPRRRRRDTDDQVIDRNSFRRRLLPVVPDRHRGIVAVAGGCGLRWGEAAGLCADALDLDRGTLRVIRTVIEVAGHTSFKPFPKSTAGRRSVPLPGWLTTILREHRERYPLGEGDMIFANEVGGALRRTLFRSRVWRPALVRAGQLGSVTPDGELFAARWTDDAGKRHRRLFDDEPAAVRHVARECAGGLRFHDLRHSYATWLVDDGVPPNMVQRVMGHERSSTTLDLYTRRTEDPTRILRALDDEEPDDPDDGPAGAQVPA
ncbi:site-specific integrase [Pseudonocardia hydrocarbonoxydans]|uniref:Site-specific integrase n=2 Tax=Pseudonocardia hydrocarbonoxydans TaxID=76726 RepID=A0A4Y3WP04_9PSEU|nr:site-specific integrase [Pseudonocardia hydrocarbonoxydans]